MKRFSLLLMLFFSLSLSSFVAPSATAQAGAQEEQSDQTIKLRGTDGRTYDLAQMRGHVILVSFGATWCQPCKEELRALEQMRDEYKDKPVKFFWVSIEPEEEVSDGKLQSFARSIKFSFPILRDTTRWTYAQFSTRQRIPLVVFFDKQGRFVAPAHAGMSTPDAYKKKMRGVLDRLLADQTTASRSAESQSLRSSN